MDYEIIKKIALDAFKIDTVSYAGCKVLTVAHDNDRSFLYNGKYYSPLVDTIEDDLARYGQKCQSVARIISTIKGGVAYGNVVSPEGAFARALVLKRLKGMFLPAGAYPYSSMEETIWEEILDATGAEKVLAIMPSRELCTVCRRRGVWVADVQHGVIADSHPWYGQRFRANDPVEWLPDAFLCWDEGSAAVIDAWAKDKKGVSTIVYGNRWVARFINRAKDDELVNSLFAANHEKISALSGKKTILLSLSWGNYNIPNGFMVDDLAEVIRETSREYNWLLRLHPNQLKGFATDDGRRFLGYFAKELQGVAEWEWPTMTALPLILANSDLHISWNSSVGIEAAQMGIKTAFLDPHLRTAGIKDDYYQYYRKKGMIDLVDETKPSISDWIVRNIDSKSQPESFETFDTVYRDLIAFLSSSDRKGYQA